jgi:hypothetical protein
MNGRYADAAFIR